MPKVKIDPTLIDLRGRLGDAAFRCAHTGEITLIKRPDMSNVKWSKAQKAHRQRFRQAVAYAKVAMAEPKVRRVYEKEVAKQHKRPFDLAVSDYFKGRDLLEK